MLALCPYHQIPPSLNVYGKTETSFGDACKTSSFVKGAWSEINPPKNAPKINLKASKQSFFTVFFCSKIEAKLENLFKKCLLDFLSLSISSYVCETCMYTCDGFYFKFTMHVLLLNKNRLYTMWEFYNFLNLGSEKKLLKKPSMSIMEGGENQSISSLLQQQRQQLSVFLDLFARYSLGPETGGGRNLGSPPADKEFWEPTRDATATASHHKCVEKWGWKTPFPSPPLPNSSKNTQL